MITKELCMAAAEVNQILRYTNDEDVNKIPIGIRRFFKQIADEKYIPIISPEISLEKQDLLPDTEKILGMLYCYYWSNESEKIPENVLLDSNVMYGTIHNSLDELNLGKKEVDNELTEIKKVPWYKKLFGWIRK